MSFSSEEIKFMRAAIALAQKGTFWVSPNPKVGAVIVKNNKVIGKGYHHKFGQDHAEIDALKDAWKASRSVDGATMFVTLEPCIHVNKKLPPCVPAIIESGIKHVVIAIKDPNPNVKGRGILALIKAGLSVRVGLMEKEAKDLNPHFIKLMTTDIPFVAMKIAASLDGKIATKSGDSKWITSEKSRDTVKSLRDNFDAILVGINTVLNDNPTLAGKHKEPVRIILDSRLRTPDNYNVLRNKNVIIATTEHAPDYRIKNMQANGFHVKNFGKKINILSLLRYLGKRNISSVFVEGGSKVFGSFIDSKLVDYLYWFVAPKIIGGLKSKLAISGNGVQSIKNAPMILDPQYKNIDSDLLIEGHLKY